MPCRVRVLFGLFALALVSRLLMLALRPGGLEFWEYETLSSNIASGSGYVISRFGHNVVAFGDGNLYSFLGGALYATLGHKPMLLAVIQALLASLAVPVLYLIAERPFGSAKAALGAALAALHPGLLAYTLKLHPLGLDALLLALIVLWTVTRPWSARDSVVAGLTLGLNLMTRPTYFVAGVISWGVRSRTRRGEWRYVVAAVAIALVVAAPWIGRNWLLLGQPVLVSTSFEDIWKGNNAAASGSSYVAPGTTVFDVAPPSLRERIRNASETQVNSAFEEATFEFVRQHPFQFVGLLARKFFYFWWLPAEAGVLYPVAWLTAYQGYLLVIYGFVAVGAIAIVRHGTQSERELLKALATIGVTLAVIHALAYVEGRHRWGIEPMLLLISARGMFAAAGWLRDRDPWTQSRVLRRLKER